MQQSPKLKSLIFLCVSFVLAFACSAQVAYHNFNSNDGLPSNEVYCVLQDHDGFLWFGTDHGVVKYNGYNFKTYTTADGLTDNTVLEIKEDDEGKLWFLTFVGGLNYFDGLKFVAHPNNDTITKLCSKSLPTSWGVMKNYELWLGFSNKGFYKIEANKVESITDTIPGSSDSVTLYVLSFNDNKYVYTFLRNGKLDVIKRAELSDISSITISKKLMPYPNLNISLHKLPDGALLLNQWNYVLHINKHQKCIGYNWPINIQTLQNKVTANGKVWLTSRNMPTYSLALNNDAIQFIDSIAFSSSVSNIISDRQNNYWVTTTDKGIYMIPNDKVRIYDYSHLHSSGKISGLLSDSKSLYAILPEGKLLEIDTLLSGRIREPLMKEPGPISSLSFRKNGALLSNQDTSLNCFAHLHSYITQIEEIAGHQYLIGTPSGLYICKGSIETSTPASLGFSKRITGFHKLSDQKYAVGTISGLYYILLDAKPRIVADNVVNDVRITSVKTFKNIFAVATRGKGVYINIDNHFYNVNETGRLINNLAEEVYFENDSTLWVATFKGVSKIYFHVKNLSLVTRVKNYTENDGLCSNQVNSIAGFNGYIWLATNEGLCYLRPNALSEDTAHIPLYFGAILVNGEKHPADSLVLTHDENNIFIEFNALYYKAIGGIRYKVRLKGISPWKYTTLNYIQYYSLPPGDYQFEVAAEDKDGKYRSEIHTLSFTIKPRFVDTLFFKIVLALMVVMLALIIISSIFSYQKLKATNVIKLLQAEFKALSYQINPHFIFNVLNSIQYYILKKDTDNAVHLLGSFSLLIRRIVNNSKQQYISVIEEVECLREYMDLEKMRLDNKFDYRINIDSGIDIEEKNILPMIIQPLVENSIWHGIVPSSKPGIINIDFKKENGNIICKVEDNGVGIHATWAKEKSQNNLSMAMKNVRERLKIIGELNDSTWEIKTEDKSVSDPTQSGTIVTIVFPSTKSK